MTQTQTAPLTDTRMMPVVHTLFRRELRLAGGLLRSVTDGDTARTAVVADHLDLVGGVLHHHHTAEDELLWPLLLERVPDELAPIVQLMESQHKRVEQLLDEITPLLAQWRRTAGTRELDRTAELYDELYVALAEHLDAEEQRLLPIAARTLTQAEWERMGEAARAGTPKAKQFVVFGMIAWARRAASRGGCLRLERGVPPGVQPDLCRSQLPSASSWAVSDIAYRSTPVRGSPNPRRPSVRRRHVPSNRHHPSNSSAGAEASRSW